LIFSLPDRQADGGRAVRRDGVGVEAVMLDGALPDVAEDVVSRGIRQEQKTAADTKSENQDPGPRGFDVFRKTSDERNEQDETHRIEEHARRQVAAQRPDGRQRRHVGEPKQA